MISFLLGSISTIAIYKSYRILNRCLPYLLPAKPLQEKVWIVTGATDGIGKQYVNYITDKGLKVIAIGRSQAKLNKLKENSSLVSTITLDFSSQQLTQQIIQNKIKQLQEVNSYGFINCCGVGFFNRFQHLTALQVQQIRKINISPIESILRLKNRSYSVINLSSASAFHPLKYSSVYSASKAYVSNLLQAYRKQNPDKKILNVEPWYVKTKMISYRDDWDSVSPRQVVENSFRLYGRKYSGLGTIKHELIDEFYLLFRQKFEIRNQNLFEKVKRLMELRDRKKK